MAFGWEWKKVFTILGVLSLCFLIIPVPVQRNDIKQMESEFQKYIKKFNKPYSANSTDYTNRFKNFLEAMKTIKMLNEGRTHNVSATFGLTEFSDLSKEEFLRRHLLPTLQDHVKKSHHHINSKHQNHHKHVKREVPANLPPKVDWRERKVVTPVKNQKICGACWAFSTIEVVESMQAISKGKLEQLSIQEAIDCAGNGNLGCNGGDMCSLVDWLVSGDIGIPLESQYPLHLKNEVCHLNKNSTGVHIASNYSCDSLIGYEERLLSLLANHGPVAVAVNALSWQYYLGGVIHFHCSGGPDMINHAVQLIGYDLTGPVPFYIARNSWGTSFGNGGYVYIGFGSNVCGVATEVVSLDVK